MSTLEQTYSTTRRLRYVGPEAKFNIHNRLPINDDRVAEGGLSLYGYTKIDSALAPPKSTHATEESLSNASTPLITVITVVFNGELSLEKTIRSVIEQTYSNVEYIIIDGNSNDGTINILRDYNHTINYWVSEKDRGLYDAMNKGLRLVNGDYFLFLNSGDTLHSPNILKEIAPHLINNLPLFFGQALIHSIDGKPLSLYPKSNVDIRRWLKRSLPNHQAMLFNTECYGHLRFREDLAVSADSVFKLAALDGHWQYCQIIISDFYLGGLSSENSMNSILLQFKDRLRRKDRFGGKFNAIIFLHKKLIKLGYNLCLNIFYRD